MKTKKIVIGGITIGGLAGLGYLAYKFWPFGKKDKPQPPALPGMTQPEQVQPKQVSLPVNTRNLPTRTAPVIDQSFPLKRGSRGERVKMVQRFLNQQYNAGLTVDGIWGAKTDAALRSANQPTQISQGAFATLEFAMKRIGLAGHQYRIY